MYYLETGTASSQSPEFRQICRIVRDLASEMTGKVNGTKAPGGSALDQFRKSLVDLPGGELAPLALYLISYGDSYLLKELWTVRGPFQVNLKRDPYENTCTLNGHPFVLLSDAPNLFECLDRVVDYQNLFRMISEMGFQGLIDTSPEGRSLFAMGNSDVIKRNCRRSGRFSGDLPKLDAGVVRQGELLQALTMGSNKPGMRMAYDSLLCWATPEMVRQHPGLLKPYTAKHEFETNGVFYPPKMTISEWSERFEADAQAGVIGTLPLNIRIQNECDDEPDVARLLLRTMASNEIQYGFDVEPGFVLCHTSAEFLHEFQFDPNLDEGKLKDAHDFVGRYLPFEMLHLAAIPGAHLSEESKYSGHSIEQFLWMLGGAPEEKERVKRFLTPSQFQAMACGTTIDGGLLAVLKTTFGFDNQGMNVKLRSFDFDTLKAAGFKFAEGTQISSAKLSSLVSAADYGKSIVDITEIREATDPEPVWKGKQAEMVKVYSAMISMGLWPCKAIPEPASVKDALLRCTRKRDFANRYNEVALSLRGYLINAGAEACAAVAKTPAQWEYLVDALGPDAMKPYVGEMTHKARGTVFTSELGV